MPGSLWLQSGEWTSWRQAQKYFGGSHGGQGDGAMDGVRARTAADSPGRRRHCRIGWEKGRVTPACTQWMAGPRPEVATVEGTCWQWLVGWNGHECKSGVLFGPY